MSTYRRKLGDIRACGKCGHDIQWLGRETGWRDRGMGRECLPTGKHDQDGVPLPTPKGNHRPEFGLERYL